MKSKLTSLPGLSVLNCAPILVNDGFNDAAAYTTIVPADCWADDVAPDDGAGDFEPHPTAPASTPASTVVDAKPASTRRMGETLSGSRCRIFTKLVGESRQLRFP